MLDQVTKGIKIAVQTNYNGTTYRNYRYYQVFSYTITITNTSAYNVQLLRRFWKIFDSLNKREIVDGEGVVGETPTLQPNESYTYQSGCYLQSNFGAMQGFYTFVNLDTQQNFKVTIPTFYLNVPALSN